MKVEIWSDIVCPYCYIGKRKYEQALARFPHAGEIETVWHSYQLDPEVSSETTQDLYDYVAEMKACSRKESIEEHNKLERLAKTVGLDYHFDKTIVANTFNAHRLIHFASQKGMQDAAEEHLFEAYFINGENINDLNTLIRIGQSIGLDGDELRRMLDSDELEDEVFQDLEEAENQDVDVVPFFLFDRRLIVTGAQSSEVFLDALTQSYEKWKTNQPDSGKTRTENDGPSCSIDGVCE